MAIAAASITLYTKFLRQKQVSSVLDYGAGNLRNARFLATAGFRVYVADVPEQVARIMQMPGLDDLAGILCIEQLEQSHLAVDLVLSTYVLNIIPDGTEKTRYLRNVTFNLRPEGYFLIEARCKVASVRCGSGCSYAHKCSSCLKTYSHQELDQMLSQYGFKRVSHYYRRHAVAVLYQLQAPAWEPSLDIFAKQSP